MGPRVALAVAFVVGSYALWKASRPWEQKKILFFDDDDDGADSRRTMKHLSFWRSAAQRAAFFAAEEARTYDAEEPPCPRVFVYDLAPELVDWRPELPNNDTEKATALSSKSEVSVPSVAVDENANLLEVIVRRLATSTRCKARSAESADLFLIPTLPRAKHWSEWSRLCETLLEKRRLDRELPHLTPATARRHFFVYPRVAYNAKCRGWWTSPMPLALASVARVAVGGYEEFRGAFQRPKTLQKLSPDQRRRPQLLVPRLVSAPYVANVRWSSSQTTRAFSPTRRYLFAYSGTPHGAPAAVELRLALRAACDAAPADCASASSFSAKGEAKPPFQEWPVEARLRSTLQMRNATFCPQPPGLTPGRSSIVTALLLGCVPVFFSEEQDELWPLHLGGWLRDARLFVPAHAILPDPARLFPRALRAVSAERLRHMQSAIAAHARRLQYALDDMPGDALEVLLRGLKAAAAEDAA